MKLVIYFSFFLINASSLFSKSLSYNNLRGETINFKDEKVKENGLAILNSISQIQNVNQILIFALSSNDCFKCSVNFNAILRDESLKNIKKIILSDEYVSAKSLIEEIIPPPDFIIDPDILQKVAPTGRSALIVKNGKEIESFEI